MKDIKTFIKGFINEANKLSDPELPYENDTIEKVAYDYNGDGWIVEAYCCVDGGACEGCNSRGDLLRDYDTSGAMTDMLHEGWDAFPYGIDTIIVGAVSEDDSDERAAWVWDYTGICYENKKYSK